MWLTSSRYHETDFTLCAIAYESGNTESKQILCIRHSVKNGNRNYECSNSNNKHLFW